MSARATRVRVWVHREESGHLLSVDSVPPSPTDIDEGDIVTEQDVWIEDLEVTP